MRLDHLFVRGSAPFRRGGASALVHDIALIRLYLMQPFFPGDHSARVIPVPIPNTEVKTRCGDGTASLGGGRVARCQDFFTGAGLMLQAGSFCLDETARALILFSRWPLAPLSAKR